MLNSRDVAKELLVRIQQAQIAAGEHVVVEHLQALGLIPATQPSPTPEKAATERPTASLDVNQINTMHNLRNGLTTYVALAKTASYYGIPILEYEHEVLAAMVLKLTDNLKSELLRQSSIGAR